MSNSFDYEQFKANAIEQLKAGEMDSHLESGEREWGNRRNGHMSKQVQTSMGEVTINTPRDRDVRHRQQHKRDKRHPGGAVRQPHIGRDHQQHHGPSPT